MTTYTFPSDVLKAAEVRFNIVARSTQSPRGPLLGDFNVVSGPVSRYWRVTMTISELPEASWRELAGFLALLDNGFAKCRLWNPGATDLLGAGAADVTVNANEAAATGATSISIKNLYASQSPALARGDFIGIGENLYMCVVNANSNSSGVAGPQIRPALRRGLGEHDPINLASPTGLFKLVSGAEDLAIRSAGFSRRVTLQFVEDPDFG